jgi:starch synthase
VLGYSDGLAHRIEAGADIFLMPSRYEPCGLNQIYSLRYGTVPVVRATGGLDDTIDAETGFKFFEYSGYALLLAMQSCLRAWDDQERWRTMMRTGMRRDFSWLTSATQYDSMYRRLLNP